MLTSSFGTNYVHNEHNDVDQYGPYSIQYEIMPWSLANQNEIPPSWLIVLTSSAGINYILNEHEEVNQYGPYAIPSEVIPR